MGEGTAGNPFRANGCDAGPQRGRSAEVHRPPARQLLNQGGGILVPMEDPQAMADAIVRVLTLSESAWKEMSDNAHATANRYTWEDATDRFEAVLMRVVRDAKVTAPRQALVGAS